MIRPAALVNLKPAQCFYKARGNTHGTQTTCVKKKKKEKKTWPAPLFNTDFSSIQLPPSLIHSAALAHENDSQALSMGPRLMTRVHYCLGGDPQMKLE